MSDIGIVFDIGGTNTRVARVEHGALGTVHMFTTVKTPVEGLALMISEIEKVAAGDTIAALSGDMAGIVEHGIIHVSPNLPAWNKTNVVDQLTAALKAPVFMMNDAELVALGEYHYGAGKGEKDMAYVTVSTGVGGAHIIDGVIVRGKFNAEIGHQVIESGKELEDLVSGHMIEKKYGVAPKDLNDIGIRNSLADNLALGLYNTTLHWSPEIFVLGGSMITGENAIPLERVRSELERHTQKYFPQAPKLVMAKLGRLGGLYGGMAHLSNVL